MDELTKVVVETLTKEGYKDLFQPVFSQVGLAAGLCMEFFTDHLRYYGEKRRLCLRRNLARYEEKLAETPADRLTRVRPEIGIPILEKLTYIEDEDLSELFLNLLATASSTDTVNLAHPSFFRVIEHLSPDEAKLLLLFKEEDWILYHYQRLAHIPTGEVRDFGPRYGKLGRVPLAFHDNLELYLCNLEGLGILRRRPLSHYEYEKLRAEMPSLFQETDAETKSLGWDNHNNITVDSPGKIEVTAYGRMFIQACVSKIP